MIKTNDSDPWKKPAPRSAQLRRLAQRTPLPEEQAFADDPTEENFEKLKAAVDRRRSNSIQRPKDKPMTKTDDIKPWMIQSPPSAWLLRWVESSELLMRTFPELQAFDNDPSEENMAKLKAAIDRRLQDQA
jgi:hypothetical protein